MTLQDLMMLYGVTLGKRRTAKQKYLFAQQLNESLPPLGWPVRVQQREGRFSKIENLIAGDLANAKVVIAVPFDTPAKALRPQKYYPFHPDKNVQQRGRDLALQCVLELLCFGAACLMFYDCIFVTHFFILRTGKNKTLPILFIIRTAIQTLRNNQLISSRSCNRFPLFSCKHQHDCVIAFTIINT